MSFEHAVLLSAVPDVGGVPVRLGGVTLAIVRDEDGEIHAVDDTCSHANVSLSEGEVDGCTIECWLHGSRFDLRTGEPTGLPAIRPIHVYPVQVEGGAVLVDVTSPLDPSEMSGLSAAKEH